MESQLEFLVISSNNCFLDFPITKYLHEFANYTSASLKVEEVDADSYPELVAKYNIKILPTLLLDEVVIFEGTTDKEEFLKILMNALVEKQNK